MFLAKSPAALSLSPIILNNLVKMVTAIAIPDIFFPMDSKPASNPAVDFWASVNFPIVTCFAETPAISKASWTPTPSFLNAWNLSIPMLVDSISVTVDLAASAASSNGPENLLNPGIAFVISAKAPYALTPKELPILSEESDILPNSIFNLLASSACILMV